MKTLLLMLLALPLAAQTATVNGQRVAFRVLVGSSSPSSTTCDQASERGSLYLQTGDQASVPTQLFACKQTGSSTYAWSPANHYVQTSAPATCDVGEMWFDSDASAGSNLNLCTSSNTWTAVSGGAGSGNLTLTSGTADPNVAPESCTPSSSSQCMYYETDAKKWWIATDVNTWEKVLSTTGSGPTQVTFTCGTAPSSPISGDVVEYCTSDVPLFKNNTGTVFLPIQSASSTSHQFLTNVDTAGVQQKAQPAFTDISGTAAAAQLPACVGDSGSGGTRGAAPAPGAGDTAAGKFLKADCTWAVPSGGSSHTRTDYYPTWSSNNGLNPSGGWFGTGTGCGVSSGIYSGCSFGTGSKQLAILGLLLPTDWGGTVSAKTLASLTGNVSGTGTYVLDIRTQCVTPGTSETLDGTSWNTKQGSGAITQSTYKASTLVSFSSLTVTGCAAGDFLEIEVSRDTTSNASDTTTEAVIFMGLEVTR